MQTTDPATLQEITDRITEDPYVVLYLSRPGCGVCTALKPKVLGITEELPEARFCHVDLNQVPEAAGEYSVYTIPAILVFVDRRETIREARYVSLEDLKNRMTRLYHLRFE